MLQATRDLPLRDHHQTPVAEARVQVISARDRARADPACGLGMVEGILR
ncbi:MAG: hypothetical protein ACLSDM_03730 [Butyricicoccus sp.]